MEGKRVRDNSYPQNPGEYSKIVTDKGTFWYAIPPMGDVPGDLRAHTVEENEDRTISVQEIIMYVNYKKDKKWQGFLRKGMWEEYEEPTES